MVTLKNLILKYIGMKNMNILKRRCNVGIHVVFLEVLLKLYNTWLIKVMREKKIFCSLNIISCSHNILICSHNIISCSLNILFCSHNISYCSLRKEVVKEIPPYFKNQSVPIVSYSYTNSIGRNIFNYKEALQDINIEEYLKNPLTCDCSHSPFQYNPSGHVITGDLNIIQHESLRKVISHGPKFREPQHINWKHNFKIIMHAVEDYARRWIKREVDQYPELESLSDWVRTIRSLVQGRIHKLKNCVNSRPKSVFKDQEAVKCLSSLHDKYVIVPADKASNNIVFVCKSYYFECLIKELGINSNTSSNTTYNPTSFDKDEILANHRSFMTSLNIPSGKESEDLPYLYWIPKLHKTPYKERYIAGSSTCSTKELSIHLTKILSAVKEGQQKYCETVYSRSGINHMWILKNSKDLLDNLKSRSFSQVSSIKTFDFSTLYTTLRMTN